MKRPVLVVLTGAGISAESGLKTFRDSDGLWEGYNVYDVATPEAWHRDPALVLDFYNQRRRAVAAARPNAAHVRLAELEAHFDVQIITQNIDDLHERAGSTQVLHLHGEIGKAQSTADPSRLYPIQGTELNPGESCELGYQLRPFVVWFGEPVPMIGAAAEITARADYFAVIGTSLAVYPAAGLVTVAPPDIPVFVVDPGSPEMRHTANVQYIREKAVGGVARLAELLLSGI